MIPAGKRLGWRYFTLLGKSAQQFLKNPVLVVPVLIQLGLMLGLALMIAVQLLVLALVNGSTHLFKPVLAVTVSNIALVVCFIILDCLAAVFIVSYTRAMRVGMIKEVLDAEQTSKQTMWLSGRMYLKNYSKFFVITSLMRLFYALVYWGGQEFLTDLGFKLKQLHYSYFDLSSSQMIVLFLLYFIPFCFELIIQFFEPVLVHTQKSLSFPGMLKHMLKYSNRHPFHGIITYFSALGFVAVFYLPAAYLARLTEINWITIGCFLYYILVVGFISAYIEKIYIFHAYFGYGAKDRNNTN
jgi:hypothetical protein